MTVEAFGFGRGQMIDLQPGHAERLVAKLFGVFASACDMQDVEAAQDILSAAQAIMDRHGLPFDSACDRSAELLVDAHYRLWELRYAAD